MIDLVALSGLFGEEFGAVARFNRMDDAEREKVCRDLRSAGHALQWVDETRLPQKALKMAIRLRRISRTVHAKT